MADQIVLTLPEEISARARRIAETTSRLKINRPALVQARQRWVKGGYHPPRRGK